MSLPCRVCSLYSYTVSLCLTAMLLQPVLMKLYRALGHLSLHRLAKHRLVRRSSEMERHLPARVPMHLMTVIITKFRMLLGRNKQSPTVSRPRLIACPDTSCLTSYIPSPAIIEIRKRKDELSRQVLTTRRLKTVAFRL